MILLCYISVPVCRYISTYMNIHMYIHRHTYAHIVVVVQSPSHVWLFVAPWTAAHQASLSRLLSWSLPKFRFIASVMPSSHLILSCPLLLLSSIFPSIREFSSESSVRLRWPKYWNFSFSISPSSEYSGLISLKIDLLAVQGTFQESSPAPQFNDINSLAFCLLFSWKCIP